MTADNQTQTLVEKTKNGAILELCLNRPDKKNALTLAMYDRLVEEMEAAENDGSVRAVLLYGKGDDFTAGNDLKDFLDQGLDSEKVLRFLFMLANFKKPLITAVNGAAVGIGTTLLFHSDLNYADETAYFSLPFVNLGLCPEAASSYLLPRFLGHAKAAELLMLAEPFDASKALAYGFINRICKPGTALEAAREAALKIAAKPPKGVRMAKALLKASDKGAVEDAISREANEFAKLLKSDEAREAMQAFFEKRKPDFSKFE